LEGAVSVRPREWISKGEIQRAWAVDYVDQEGKRRHRTFKKKKDADTFATTSKIEVWDGTHVPDSKSVTVKEAGKLWIQSCESAELERTTIEQYKQHLRLHIEPFLGRTKLSQLSAPTVRAFEDKLREQGRSPSMVRYVVRSLGALLADAQDQGLVVRNTVRERKRRKGRDRTQDRNGKLKVGVDIPTPAEIRSIVEAAEGHWRPFLITAIFTGLRASELRGLAWANVDLKNKELHVRQRADRYKEIGAPKTDAGERTVPLPPIVVNTLKEWKLKCPKSKLGLVFPNGAGNVEYHVNIIERGLKPTMRRAGVTVPVLRDGKPVLDKHGKPVVDAKYSGLHALRHFYASWCINPKEAGGMGLDPKTVQERMGHSSIVVTLDTYGHLFPRQDGSAELAAAEKALLG
jgi:integrase